MRIDARDGPGPTRRNHFRIARSPTTTDSWVWSTPIGRSEASGTPATNAESPSPGRARRHGPPYSSRRDRHDRERPARLGRQRHAQPVGQTDRPDDIERRHVGRSVAVDRRSKRPRSAATTPRNASSSPASVPYDWTSIPVT